LLASGQLDVLIQSLSRFSEKLAVLGTHAQGDSILTHSTKIGSALIFDRLWQSCSINKVLTALLECRRFEFSVERAIFLTVLHRLFAPGSDRAAEKWKDDYAIETEMSTARRYERPGIYQASYPILRIWPAAELSDWRRRVEIWFGQLADSKTCDGSFALLF
jgi:hypothetical protein